MFRERDWTSANAAGAVLNAVVRLSGVGVLVMPPMFAALVRAPLGQKTSLSSSSARNITVSVVDFRYVCEYIAAAAPAFTYARLG